MFLIRLFYYGICCTTVCDIACDPCCVAKWYGILLLAITASISNCCINKSYHKMLFLLVSIAMLSAAFGQSNCPSLRAIQSSQQSLANVTAQLKGIVASYNQQQSSESLTNLMQLLLARQLMAEIDGNKPATGDSANSPAANDSCDCNGILTTLMQLVTRSIDNTEAIQNLTTIIQRLAQGMATADGYRPSPLLHSCEEIRNKWPGSSSDFYTIVDTNGRRRHVYCEMEQVCGSSGWMRVAYLNMTDPSEECPRGFRLYNQNGVRACRQTLPHHLVVDQTSAAVPTHTARTIPLRCCGSSDWLPVSCA